VKPLENLRPLSPESASRALRGFQQSRGLHANWRHQTPCRCARIAASPRLADPAFVGVRDVKPPVKLPDEQAEWQKHGREVKALLSGCDAQVA
jgi:hypothetical protein